MNSSDIPRQPTATTLRQFAVMLLVLFLVIAARQYWGHGRIAWAIGLAVGAVAAGGLGCVWPATLRPLFVGWMMLALPIGWLMSQLMLGLVFFGIMTPIALVMRWRGRDRLHRRRINDRSSYWVDKESPIDARRHFRQY